MARYLLSSASIFEIIQNHGLPAEKWLAEVSKRGISQIDIYISAVAQTAVRRQLRLFSEDPARSPFEPAALMQLSRNATAFFETYENADDQIVAVDHIIAERWSELLDISIAYLFDGQPEPIGAVQKIEIATAIVGRHNLSFAFVERAHPDLLKLPGLSIEDPTKPLPTV
jgi:hypothetical protein